IEWEARQSTRLLGSHLAGYARQFGLELIQALSGDRADGNDRGRSGIEERSANEVFDFEANDLESVSVDQIRLSENDDATRDCQQAADIEMLASLRLYGFVGGDHQQHNIDAAHTGEHVAHETFVPGNVNKSQANLIPGW